MYQEKEKVISNHIYDMLTEYMPNINIDRYAHLSDKQKNALNLFKDGHNLLIIGVAGSGKSFIIETLKTYNDDYDKKKLYVTATTGISAYSVKGITIHSFLGIGTGDLDIENLIRKINKKKLYRNRILETDILIIDEISMMSAELFEKINKICQYIRKNKKIFGGIQLILTGDFYQLTPVFNRNIELNNGNIQDTRLIIESDDFNNTFNKKNIIVLTENFRQKNDPLFINILSRIRDGTFTEDDVNIIKNRLNIQDIKGNPVHIVSTNKKAQNINDTNLLKIKENSKYFDVIYNNNSTVFSEREKEIIDLLTKELSFQFKQKGIEKIQLKKNSRVMLIKNIDVTIGLVNGSLGTIHDFSISDYPIVLFDNGEKIEITPLTWDLELDNIIVTATQIPLMLSYAITTHKSQSLSLDSAILDLGDCFTEGQCYVALSRVRNLEGIYLKSFNPSKIKVNQKMHNYMINL